MEEEERRESSISSGRQRDRQQQPLDPFIAVKYTQKKTGIDK
jgi:hypothetical protein